MTVRERRTDCWKMTRYNLIIYRLQILYFWRIVNPVLHLPDLVLEVLGFLRAIFLSTFQSIELVGNFFGLILLQDGECLLLGVMYR